MFLNQSNKTTMSLLVEQSLQQEKANKTLDARQGYYTYSDARTAGSEIEEADADSVLLSETEIAKPELLKPDQNAYRSYEEELSTQVSTAAGSDIKKMRSSLKLNLNIDRLEIPEEAEESKSDSPELRKDCLSVLQRQQTIQPLKRRFTMVTKTKQLRVKPISPEGSDDPNQSDNESQARKSKIAEMISAHE